MPALENNRSGIIRPEFRKTAITAAVIAALAPASAAIAQDQDNSTGLEEIVVTATKRSMDMQDLGQSIQAFSTQDIAKQSFQGMEDYMRALPSVSLMNDQPGRNSIVMRGLSTGTQEFYTDSQVAMYLDEQPITTISQQVDVRLIDIARIEALPGPQGTLFGSSSQAGTIRVITNRPDPTGFSSMVDASYWTTDGGDGSYDFSGWVNIPLIADTLAVRAVAFSSHEGGYVDNVLGTTLEGSEDNAAYVKDNQNEYDNTGGRIAARWIMSEGWEMDLSYIAQSSELDGAWGTDPSLGDYKLTKFFDEYRNDEWDQGSVTLLGDLGFAELVATASFFDRDIEYEWDNMVYEQWKDSYWGPYYDLYNSDYTFGSVFNDQQVERTAYELRLASTNDSRFQWMIGGFYEDSTDHWFYGARNDDYVGTTSWYAAQYYAYYYNYLGYDVQYPLPPTNIGYSEDYTNTITQTAVFGEVTFDLIPDKWDITVGSRWFEFDRSSDFILQFPQGLPPFGSFATGGAYSASGTESDTVFKFGTTFSFDDDVMMYAMYSEGFRLGGNNSPRAAGTGFVPFEYEPDKVENIEMGVKSRFANDKIQLNVIAFQVTWENIQNNSSSVDGQWWLRGTVNGGEGQNRGVEITFDWQATENLRFNTYATFSDPKFTEDVVKVNDTVPAGTPMAWAAKEKYRVGVEYQIPDVLGGYMWMSYNYSYEGEKWNNTWNAQNNDPQGIVPAWNLSDAHIGLIMENGWDFSINVRNIWNEKAWNSLSNDSGPSGQFGDPRFNNIRNYAKPRTIGFTIRKYFE